MRYLVWDEFRKRILKEYKGIKRFRLFTVKQMLREVGFHVHSTEWHQLLQKTEYMQLPKKSGWYLVTTQKGNVTKAFCVTEVGSPNPDFKTVWFTYPKEWDKETGKPISNIIEPIAWTELPKPYSIKETLKAIFLGVEDEL